jgi:hypothetical protein
MESPSVSNIGYSYKKSGAMSISRPRGLIVFSKPGSLKDPAIWVCPTGCSLKAEWPAGASLRGISVFARGDRGEASGALAGSTRRAESTANEKEKNICGKGCFLGNYGDISNIRIKNEG